MSVVNGQRLPSGDADALTAAGVYREEFGFDASSSAAAQYCSFASSVVERNATEQNPRPANFWRAPFSGTLTGFYLTHESDAAGVNFELREVDGTVVGSENASTASFAADGPVSTDTFYRTSLSPDAWDVVEGELYTLVVDPSAVIGEVTGWLELTPA